MTDSVDPDAGRNPDIASWQPLDAAGELELHPVEGIPKWFGNRAIKLVLRALSMEEQPRAFQSGPLSPLSGYFRRDRHIAPKVDPGAYTLDITGVRSPRTLGLRDLQDLPQEDSICVQECAGNGNHLMGSAGLIGQAHYRGPSFRSVIDACGGSGAAEHFVFRGLDGLGSLKKGYHYGLSLGELTRSKAIIALRMNGASLTRRHGFPARLVVPQIYAHSHVKWLSHIEGLTSHHTGWHNRMVYVNKARVDGRWVKQEARWIGLKSLVTRCVKRSGGGYVLHGWAWGGEADIARVAVSTNGGATWQEAEVTTAANCEQFSGLTPEALTDAWATFRIPWDPARGRYRVGTRAYDTSGREQDLLRNPDIRGDFDQCHVKWREVAVP